MQWTPVVALAAIVALSPAISAQIISPATPVNSSTPSALDKDASPDWERAVNLRRKELIERNGPGTEAALRDRLLKMSEIDQDARSLFTEQLSAEKKEEMIKMLPVTDAELTKELKQIVDQKGWPTIALVGINASDAAMLVLSHTADHAWQRQLLPQLEKLANSDSIDASNLANLVDIELVSEGKLQRYGTRFKFMNGDMAMFAVEDPANLDQRRAKALLPPLKFYKETMAEMYHLRATDAIVSSTPTSKQ